MKLIRTEDAVGHVLCHDLTQIIKDQYKDARFRKGHVVTAEDIPVLLSMGKEHLYVWEMEPGMLHENEAAERLYALCANDHMDRSGVKEGKIELRAACDGLFRVRSEALRAVNDAIDELMIATRKGGTAVKKGDKLAGMRVIPLVIREEKLDAAKAAAGDAHLLELWPWVRRTAAIVATGSEVKKGLIQDTFTPVVKDKLKAYGIETISVAYSGDGVENVANAVTEARQTGAEVILCTGGMSVDPDDNTPRRHPGHGSGDRHLRRAGAARCHVPAGLLRGRHPRHGPAGVRHVRRGPPSSTWCCPGSRQTCPSPGTGSSPLGRADCAWGAASAAIPSAPSENKPPRAGNPERNKAT